MWSAALIVDEFCTTRKFFVCGWDTASTDYYRKRRCTNPVCGILTDRDVNGLHNIGQTGYSEMVHGVRPGHLVFSWAH